MTVDHVARVQKLIALTASANENESRNAAALACKLIREHKLELVRPKRSEKKLRPEPKPYATTEDIADFIRNSHPGAGYRSRRTGPVQPGARRVVTVAEGLGTCWVCKGTTGPGDRIFVGGFKSHNHEGCE